MARHKVLKLYDDFKKEGSIQLYSSTTTTILSQIYKESLKFLKNKSKIDLESKVKDKEYFSFIFKNQTSRAINKELFEPKYELWERFNKLILENNIGKISNEEVDKILYTMAISFCSCVDLIKSGDQKTPGTFFEYFIGFFFTWRVGKEPDRKVQILNIDEDKTSLPTDFVFNLGSKKQKFHLPIKTSTRERSIMLWAHQRLLDGIYGAQTFMGTPVLLAETKTDKRKGEVVEICLPHQWKMYQMYIAKLKRIYYLDLPPSYMNLNNEFPPISVKRFSEFFYEWSKLTPN